jgi:hypothetical protein
VLRGNDKKRKGAMYSDVERIVKQALPDKMEIENGIYDKVINRRTGSRERSSNLAED